MSALGGSPWRSVLVVAGLTIAGAVLAGAFVLLPPDHPVRIGSCVVAGTGLEPVALQLAGCDSAAADARIIGITEDISFGLSEPGCNDETDVVITVDRSVRACARRFADPHPGDVGQGGGVHRPGDCREGTGSRRLLESRKEVPCADPSAGTMVLARVEVSSQCPAGTRDVDLGTSRVACVAPVGPTSAAQVVAAAPVCPGCGSRSGRVVTVVAVVVGLAAGTSLVALLAHRASARARRPLAAFNPEAMERAPATTWWQLSGWVMRLVGSVALVLSGFGLFTFFSLGGLAGVGGRDETAARIAFGLGAVWLTAVGVILWRTGRRLSAPTAEQALRRDTRPPILYLRSFRDDDTTSRQIVPLYPLFRRYTEEEQLARALRGAGPVVAIGRPGEQLPEVGAARLYVEEDGWQSTVSALIDRAGLVVVRAAPVVVGAATTTGLQWELEQVVGRESRPELLLLIPFDADGYEQLRERLRGRLGDGPGVELPPFVLHPKSARRHPTSARRSTPFDRVTLRGAAYVPTVGESRWMPFWWGFMGAGRLVVAPGLVVGRYLRRELRPVLASLGSTRDVA